MDQEAPEDPEALEDLEALGAQAAQLRLSSGNTNLDQKARAKLYWNG